METYLLTWNPDLWSWVEEDIQKDRVLLRELGPEGFAQAKKPRWSISTNYRRIELGDRLFLTQVDKEPRGIFASGHAASYPYEHVHWNGEEGRLSWYVDVTWDTLLNPYDTRSVLLRDELKSISAEQRWSPQSSGEHVKEEAAASLELEWHRFVGASPTMRTPEEDHLMVSEGAAKRGLMTRYERNPTARKKCIEAHGVSCVVCRFNFEEDYGRVGKGFVHIHHLTPVSEMEGEYELNPVEDMRPVCPNCHAMIHQRTPPYTIEELRKVRRPKGFVKRMRRRGFGR